MKDLKNNTFSFVFTFFLILLSRPAISESLLDALGLAYANNPGLKAARAQLRAVDESVSIANSGWRPSLSASGNLSRSRTETEIRTAIGSGALVNAGITERTSKTSALNLSQPIFRGFRTLASSRSAKASVEAQRARLKSSEQQVLLLAASSYLDVLRDAAVVNLRVSNVQVLRRQLEATRDRFRVGEITRTDVAQAEARLAASVSSRILAEGNLQSSRASYINVVGKAPENLSKPGPIGVLPTSLDQAVGLATDNNPSLIASRFTAESAKQNVRNVRGELLPTISLSGQVSKSWDTISDNSLSENASGRLALTLPLYQGGVTYARLRQSKHTLGQRELEADQARLDARENATSAWESYQAALASIEAIQTQIVASEIALEGVQREAEVGARTVLDVLDAEQELLDARVDLVSAERNQLVASLQVLASVGRLTGQQIGLGLSPAGTGR